MIVIEHRFDVDELAIYLLIFHFTFYLRVIFIIFYYYYYLHKNLI